MGDEEPSRRVCPPPPQLAPGPASPSRHRPSPQALSLPVPRPHQGCGSQEVLLLPSLSSSLPARPALPFPAFLPTSQQPLYWMPVLLDTS